MPEDIVIGLKTLSIRSQVAQMKHTDTRLRPFKKRVFTDDEWVFLHTLTDEDLHGRIQRGRMLTTMLENYEWMNMTRKQAKTITSNLHFQMEAIQCILDERSKANG